MSVPKRLHTDRAVLEPATEELTAILDAYDRCLSYTVSDDGTITAKSGKYPHWRRFQRDFHGPSINIQAHGYVMTHVHKRTMLESEMDADPNVDLFTRQDGSPLYPAYQNRPEVTILTLKPVLNHIQEGIDGPRVRA